MPFNSIDDQAAIFAEIHKEQKMNDEHIDAIEELKRLEAIYAASRSRYCCASAGTEREKNALAEMDYNANRLAVYVKHCLEEGFIQ